MKSRGVVDETIHVVTKHKYTLPPIHNLQSPSRDDIIYTRLSMYKTLLRKIQSVSSGQRPTS